MSNTMLTAAQAQAKIKALSAQGIEIAESKTLTHAQKNAKLAPIEAEIDQHMETLAFRKKNAFASFLGEENADLTGIQGVKSTGAAPKLNLSREDLKSLHQAALSKQAYRVTTKTSDPGASLPAVLRPGIVGKTHEPTRILDHIPTGPMDGPSVEFMTHTSTTGTAGMVARGTAKPEVSLNLTPTILTARKIAVHTAVPDEILHDFGAFSSYVTQELNRLIADVENDQVLNGLGTGENLTGILTVSGLLTRAVATDTPLDAVEQAIKDLRVGPSYCDADLMVLNPNDFSKIRRSKDSQGRYLLNPDPSADEADNIWGIPVVQTTQIAAGTGLVGNFQIGAEGFVREGFTLTTSNQSGTDFTTNLTRYLAEERIQVGVSRPSAFVKLTGL